MLILYHTGESAETVNSDEREFCGQIIFNTA